MAYRQIGGAATGAVGGVMGGINCANAIKVLFSTAMSNHPRLEAWDNATDLAAQTAPSDEILAGTASSGNNSWLAGADTTSATPGQDWYPSAENGSGTSPSLLNGTDGYVLLDDATVGVASRLFNLCLQVPSDAAQTSTVQHQPVIGIRYYYTGTEPGVSFQYNSSTEATPVWATFAHGSAGETIYFTGSGTATDALDTFIRPGAIAEVNEYWISTTA